MSIKRLNQNSDLVTICTQTIQSRDARITIEYLGGYLQNAILDVLDPSEWMRTQLIYELILEIYPAITRSAVRKSLATMEKRGIIQKIKGEYHNPSPGFQWLWRKLY